MVLCQECLWQGENEELIDRVDYDEDTGAEIESYVCCPECDSTDLEWG